MPYEHPEFANLEVYHLYNRGVAKQIIFNDWGDYQRFVDCLSFYLDAKPERKLSTAKKWGDELRATLSRPAIQPMVEILAYCLMSNHFHLAVRQLTENGISLFMQRTLNSYVRYYNTRHSRVGPLFQGTYRAVHVETDEQLLHMSRYLHLNPHVARLTGELLTYPWSSYGLYLANRSNRLCRSDFILKMIGGAKRYENFVTDYASYAADIALVKDLVIDEE